MRETAAELKANAQQVVKLLDGMKTIAVAAPAPDGDPLVAPMDGWFLHGKFLTYSRTPKEFPS